jgi:WD40 repeat protein
VDVAFRPDGTRVATASGDGTAKVWNVSTGSARSEQPLTLYNPGGVQVTGVAFSPDGKRLAASSNDGTVRVYALPLNDILTIAKSRVTRALTTDDGDSNSCNDFAHNLPMVAAQGARKRPRARSGGR